MRQAVRHLPKEKQDEFCKIWDNASSQQQEFILNYAKYSTMKAMVADDNNHLTVKYNTIRNWDKELLIRASDLLRETRYTQMQHQFAEMAPDVAKRLKEIIESSDEKVSLKAVRLFMDHYSTEITKNKSDENTVNIKFVE